MRFKPNTSIRFNFFFRPPVFLTAQKHTNRIVRKAIEIVVIGEIATQFRNTENKAICRFQKTVLSIHTACAQSVKSNLLYLYLSLGLYTRLPWSRSLKPIGNVFNRIELSVPLARHSNDMPSARLKLNLSGRSKEYIPVSV